jgi:hypothetical protein
MKTTHTLLTALLLAPVTALRAVQFRTEIRTVTWP